MIPIIFINIANYKVHILNIFYNIFSRVIAIACFLIATPIFIHYSTVEKYGLVSIGFSILTISIAIDSSLSYTLVQIIGRKYARSRSILKSSSLALIPFYIRNSAIISVFGIVLILIINLPRVEQVLYISILACLPGLCLSSCVAAIYQAHNKLKEVNVSRLLFDLSKAIGLVISGMVYGDVTLVGPIILIITYVRAYYDYLIIKKKMGIVLPYYKYKINKEIKLIRLSTGSVYLILTIVFAMSVNIFDKLIISSSLGNNAVAYYSIGLDISSKGYMLVYAVNAAMSTVILHNYILGKSINRPIFLGLMSVFIMIFVFYIPLFIYSEEIIQFWLPKVPYLEIIDNLKVCIIASVIYLFGNVFEGVLIAKRKLNYLLFIYFISTIIYWIAIYVIMNDGILINFTYCILFFNTSLFFGFFICHLFFEKNINYRFLLKNKLKVQK